MKPLTEKMHDTIIDLYEYASEHGIIKYHPTDQVHHMILKGLARRNLIQLKAQHNDSGISWLVAITDDGIAYVVNDKQPTVINDKRQMKTIAIQLDQNNSDHASALGHIAKLKSNREFTATLVNLLELHSALSAGDTSKLIDLYPGLDPDAIPAPASASGEFNQMMQHISEIKNLIETRPTSSGGAPKQLQPVASNGGGGLNKIGGAPKQLGAPKLDAPNFDDEDDSDLLQVKKQKSTGQANLNFIESVMKLNGGTL